VHLDRMPQLLAQVLFDLPLVPPRQDDLAPVIATSPRTTRPVNADTIAGGCPCWCGSPRALNQREGFDGKVDASDARGRGDPTHQFLFLNYPIM